MRLPGALILLLGVGCAVLASGGPGPAAVASAAADVAPYLHALATGALGQVQGLASREPRRPAGPSVPYPDVSVLLLPFAPELEAQLDQVKAHLRDSVSSYVDTFSEITTLRESYEHRLLAAGGGELIRGDVSDPEGRLRLSGVPEGEWLLLGWREDAHPLRPTKSRGREAGKFADRPVSVGYAAVSYWRMRISVRAGEVTSVNLSDRSVWVTVVREQLVERAAPESAPSMRRR